MKGLSYTTRLPLIPVNHIEGHVSANFLTTPDLEPVSYTHLDVYKRQIYTGSASRRPNCLAPSRIFML